MGRIMEGPVSDVAAPASPAPVILVVDDDASHRHMIMAVLQSIGLPFKGASNAFEALQIIGRNNFALVVSDINMGGINGLKFMQETHRVYPHIPFIIITGHARNYDYEAIINLGTSDFIAKPFSNGELKAKILRILREGQTVARLQESLIKTKKAFNNIVMGLASTLEIRDPYTAGHQRRVAELSGAIARELGLAAEQIEVLHLAALIYDVGKIGVPAAILAKPGKLSHCEMNLIKSHSQISYDILQPLDFPWPIADIVHQHHERLNGSGYPQKLRGEAICLEARIIGVADVVEAMSAHRPYRPALDLSVALAEISQNRGILYDEQIVDICIDLLTTKGFKFSG
jgi:putative two-component system response regulator